MRSSNRDDVREGITGRELLWIYVDELYQLHAHINLMRNEVRRTRGGTAGGSQIQPLA
ncbi:MAG: hypothetical protein QF629_06160 [Alphaproteobacteria bacterium]|nr:hypothetical protein [Alphaproteobacteria bacterium]MDP6239151.1 hypothetical protein [Alphaproteobacteria bacterium]MDP7174293.1 hypothetical protein [Alphaproteobacteria bacterium]MDP7233266.1 hypothetical protein [Alphaproteobacteria bacterium]MDP7487534.1 hypothetical protein [Alphaproteobacteria bacterium]